MSSTHFPGNRSNAQSQLNIFVAKAKLSSEAGQRRWGFRPTSTRPLAFDYVDQREGFEPLWHAECSSFPLLTMLLSREPSSVDCIGGRAADDEVVDYWTDGQRSECLLPSMLFQTPSCLDTAGSGGDALLRVFVVEARPSLNIKICFSRQHSPINHRRRYCLPNSCADEGCSLEIATNSRPLSPTESLISLDQLGPSFAPTPTF
ncbi:hypothetical protein RB195_009852 [Necator americanus]|uniref:Uncharacterized protein n=1 Tax=Necator americanus TaxID=51031 RepID=A0ABR1CVR3_NECAM